ncbi:MAG TPA: GNAT family N-acetyltransferase [Noviherbaspirillum sp.]|jgi:hypothetical protein|uniref:GNAT family N-acetyltransferase n=1 Tax=Noviherbaspirillum sp. TaxID=1926288 RepID=UPI002F931110
MQCQEVTISLYEGAVPGFASVEMDRLYQNPFSSLLHHAQHGSIDAMTSTYVARMNGRVTTALMFRREKGVVRVLNEQLQIDAGEMERFARHVYAAYPDVNIIEFHAVAVHGGRLSLPYQRFHCTEDIVLELPSDAGAYRARLGKSTRSYISRYMNKLRREFPDMVHEVREGGQAAEADLRAIIAMNAARMEGKQHESYIDEAETGRIIEMVRRHGLVSTVRLRGRLCAGAINVRVGGNYFLKVIAHDPAYDEYRLGTLCCFLTICACIERGGREYHFLWGRYEYKYRLAGVQRDLDHIAVYRSRRQALRNGRLVLRNALTGCSLEARSWLTTMLREHASLVSAWRRTKHVLGKPRQAGGACRVRPQPNDLR